MWASVTALLVQGFRITYRWVPFGEDAVSVLYWYKYTYIYIYLLYLYKSYIFTLLVQIESKNGFETGNVENGYQH